MGCAISQLEARQLQGSVQLLAASCENSSGHFSPLSVHHSSPVEELVGAASLPVELEVERGGDAVEAGADDAKENDSGRRLHKCSSPHVPAPGW